MLIDTLYLTAATFVLFSILALQAILVNSRRKLFFQLEAIDTVYKKWFNSHLGFYRRRKVPIEKLPLIYRQMNFELLQYSITDKHVELYIEQLSQPRKRSNILNAAISLLGLLNVASLVESLPEEYKSNEIFTIIFKNLDNIVNIFLLSAMLLGVFGFFFYHVIMEYPPIRESQIKKNVLQELLLQWSNKLTTEDNNDAQKELEKLESKPGKDNLATKILNYFLKKCLFKKIVLGVLSILVFLFLTLFVAFLLLYILKVFPQYVIGLICLLWLIYISIFNQLR